MLLLFDRLVAFDACGSDAGLCLNAGRGHNTSGSVDARRGLNASGCGNDAGLCLDTSRRLHTGGPGYRQIYRRQTQ